jgi:GNAT superfamily N-acetyltransferase
VTTTPPPGAGLPGDVTIRPAVAGDATAVADVYLASRRQDVAFAPLAHGEDDVRWWVAEVLLQDGDVQVAVDAAGEVVGMLSTSSADGVGWVDHLYVAPGRTGAGIGRALLDVVRQRLGPPLRLYTFQQNAGARRFYEREGFAVLRHNDGSDNEEHVPDVLYEWDPAAAGRPGYALDQVVVDCRSPRTLVRFWASLLGGEPVDRAHSWSHVQPPGFARMAFQPVPEEKSGKNRLHLDVAVADIARAVAHAVGLGATTVGGVVTDEQGSFQVVLDPEGNEFCFVTS